LLPWYFRNLTSHSLMTYPKRFTGGKLWLLLRKSDQNVP
jgi:hypothetical protein